MYKSEKCNKNLNFLSQFKSCDHRANAETFPLGVYFSYTKAEHRTTQAFPSNHKSTGKKKNLKYPVKKNRSVFQDSSASKRPSKYKNTFDLKIMNTTASVL